jgi:hypothetical protein
VTPALKLLAAPACDRGVDGRHDYHQPASADRDAQVTADIG